MAKGLFKLGDIVQLKSGGPAMTINDSTDYGWRCQWFRGASLEQGHFEEHTLKHYVAPKKND